MNTLGYEFTQDEITRAAVSTFLLVIIISLSFATIDYIRRVITVIRPTKEIQKCLNELTHGDFSARVKPTVSESYFGDIANDINKLAKELSSVETLRSDFISNVSHEIKTPLAIIQNYGMLLSDSNLNDEKRIEYAKVITKSSRQLAELVTNILRLNKLENQEIFPSKESFNLSEELCSSLLSFEDIWNERNIEIEVDIEEEIYTLGDAALLSLVWNNLLSNAFKFTPPGGRVRVYLKLYNDKAVVRVEDSGIGMSEDTIKHIFEKFYQGDTSHREKGNGLGLALAKRIVDIHNGEIDVLSEIKKGSSFIVTLPHSEKHYYN
ncbi:HAMP domain-containing sensor histidine kinase [Bullifex porci]|uniref:sensor histidine kinase n=1 Tax=Bullifex porci TaxID=2606638 RepID=UPI0023F493F9|nr:HAMP domain-containing sensor histidine kinase [Bullifex porci]MDD7256083.1 HAMP domain-containing sensor histidine kinase [Bullifex porci]MDY2741168.1 HAMP domain-containing sensor histidine kinase [Bullifex porci]